MKNNQNVINCTLCGRRVAEKKLSKHNRKYHSDSNVVLCSRPALSKTILTRKQERSQ